MIGTTLASLWAAESTGEDWPRFLGPRGDGVSSETGLLEKWPAKGPPLLWEKQVGAGYSAPSVRGSRLARDWVFFPQAGRKPAREPVDEARERVRLNAVTSG